jgi:hypothetical protein
MQSLWGCAYEMRSLGDVNYKITFLKLNPTLENKTTTPTVYMTLTGDYQRQSEKKNESNNREIRFIFATFNFIFLLIFSRLV